MKDVAPQMADKLGFLFQEYCLRPELVNIGEDYRRREQNTWKLLLPWLNTETMTETETALFSVIHYRLLHPPAAWATWDCHQHKDAWKYDHFLVELSTVCVSLSVESYGEVTRQESIDHSLISSGVVLGYPRAKPLLEAQRNLSQFLLAAVLSILDATELRCDFESKPPVQERWIAAARADFRHDGPPTIGSSYIDRSFAKRNPYTHQAFGPVPSLVFPVLRSKVVARKNLSVDHLFKLQTDMRYMQRHLRDLREATLIRLAPDNAIGEVMGRYFALVFKNSQSWHMLEEELENAERVWKRCQAELARTSILPEALDRALGALEIACVKIVELHSARLFNLAPYMCASGNRLQGKLMVKQLFTDGGGQSNRDSFLGVKPEWLNDEAKWLSEDPLDWCIKRLSISTDGNTGFDESAVINLLEQHLASCNVAEKSRLDSIMMEQLSDLATAHEVLMAVRSQRPWNKTYLEIDFILTERRSLWNNNRMNMSYLAMLRKELDKSGHKFYQEFFTPKLITSRSAQGKASQYERARAALETFWVAMRTYVKAQYAISDLTAKQKKTLLAPIGVAESKDYPMLVQQEKDALIGVVQVTAISPSFESSASGADATSSKLSELKIKEKTRPVQTCTAPDNTSAKQKTTPAQMVTKTRIRVTEQAHRVFMRMFPQLIEERAETTDWEEFVSAMSSAGCAVQNGGGSAVSFGLASKGRVAFHRPHPDSTVHPIRLREMGWRLNKWFGWSREHFVRSD